MLRAFRGHLRFTASLTMTVVAVVLLATCAAEAMTPEEMACCASMKGDCDMAMSAPCCSETPDHHSAVATKPTTGGPSHATVLAAVLAAPALPVRTSSRVLIATAASAASPPGVATYILVSSFRI